MDRGEDDGSMAVAAYVTVAGLVAGLAVLVWVLLYA